VTTKVVWHHSFHREGKTDLKAFQADARWRLKLAQIPTIIHHHSKEDWPVYPECLIPELKHERVHNEEESE